MLGHGQAKVRYMHVSTYSSRQLNLNNCTKIIPINASNVTKARQMQNYISHAILAFPNYAVKDMYSSSAQPALSSEGGEARARAELSGHPWTAMEVIVMPLLFINLV